MIKSLFLPDRIGTKRILAARIAGIAIGDDAVRLSIAYAKRNKTILETLLEVPFSTDEALSPKERVTAALATVAASLKNSDQITLALPSSLVVFKEITLHFTDAEKIRMVLEYEIEPMLPFATKDAIIDFVVTHVDQAAQTSQVLVAAVRTEDLADYLDTFATASINPTNITIDLFAQYNLFAFINDLHPSARPIALVDLGLNTVRIALVCNGQLRLTRHLPRGLLSVLKQIAEENKIPLQELEEKLVNIGITTLSNDTVDRSILDHFTLLLNDIQFTLNSFSMKLSLSEDISHILFTGALDKIKGFVEYCSSTTQIPCAIFEPQKVLATKGFVNKLQHDPTNWMPFTVALGSAFIHPMQYDFDLRRKSFVFQQKSLAQKQVIVALGLTFLLFAVLGLKGFLDIRDLRQEVDTIEQREINRFKSEGIFPKDKFPKNPTLAKVVREAERYTREKSDLWAPFTQSRMNPLAIWLQLTVILNKKQFDVTVKELSISTKDDLKPKIELDGIFRSKTGDHFVDWGGLLGRFKEAPAFKLIDFNEPPAPEGGVNFSISMIQRDE